MAQYIYRRPPYPYYDLEGIESWLEDLIRDGLWLDQDGYVFGLMQFRPGTPKKLKYRLEPVQKQNLLHYLSRPEPPSQKALELYEEFGWEYLGAYLEFHVYRSLEEDPVEPNTDPTLQALAFRNVRRRTGYFLAFGIFLTLVCLVALSSAEPLLNLIHYGWARSAWMLLFLLAVNLYYLIPFLHIRSVQKKLEQGQPLSRNKNWRKGRLIRQILVTLPFLFYLISSLFNAHSTNAIFTNPVDAASWSQPLPFVTLAEITPDRTLDPAGEPELSIWSTFLTPTNIYWSQQGNLTHPEEERWIGSLEVQHHETSSTLVAKALVREYRSRQDRYLRQLNAPSLSYSSENYRAEDYGFDELLVYDSLYDTVLIIREGNQVIRASCELHTWGEKEPLFLLWLEQMAERFA